MAKNCQVCLDLVFDYHGHEVVGASSSTLHDQNNDRIHLPTQRSFLQTLWASRKRSSISTFSCPCAHCRPLSPSIELSYVILACDI